VSLNLGRPFGTCSNFTFDPGDEALGYHRDTPSGLLVAGRITA